MIRMRKRHVVPAVLLLPGLFTIPAQAERVTEPRTLVVAAEAVVREAPGGAAAEHWSAGTLFTSNRISGDWIRATGHFPDGRWSALESPRWLKRSKVRERGAKTARSGGTTVDDRPRTYRLRRRTRLHTVPEGEATDTAWEAGQRFTSNHRDAEWVRVTGHFPDGQWRPWEDERWLPRAAVEDISPPADIERPDGAERWIRVDKDRFRLEVRQRLPDGSEERLFTTRVGIGMDRCLPEEEGGRCYFTEPGEYTIRWRIHEPDGIEWCIPESMEEEPRYREAIERGQRCFPNALGRLALNIGGPYAIHGTQDPEESLGRAVTHGCVRVRNDAMERVWRYMQVGDRVEIVEG
ncbi:MAG: L,D-transpeptidase [Pseudomonadota bacterium]